MLPLLTYSRPRAVSDALRWRHSTLDLARERAQSLGLKGAAFPWRTIAGPGVLRLLARRHRGVPHQRRDRRAVRPLPAAHRRRGVRARGGRRVARRDRAAVALARPPRLAGRFRIDGVTGPDEYSAIADNNVYTNLMAAQNLRAAAAAIERHPDPAQALGRRPGRDRELARRRRRHIHPLRRGARDPPQAEGFTGHAACGTSSDTPPGTIRCC